MYIKEVFFQSRSFLVNDFAPKMISLLNYKETVVTLEKPAFAQSCDALFVQVIFLYCMNYIGSQ